MMKVCLPWERGIHGQKGESLDERKERGNRRMAGGAAPAQRGIAQQRHQFAGAQNPPARIACRPCEDDPPARGQAHRDEPQKTPDGGRGEDESENRQDDLSRHGLPLPGDPEFAIFQFYSGLVLRTVPESFVSPDPVRRRGTGAT